MERWMLVLSALVAIALLALPAAADWDPGDPHTMHFPQLPDLDDAISGAELSWDVRLADGLDPNSNPVLADEWEGTETGPVTDIHLWVSWEGDLEGVIPEIELTIWSDLDESDPNNPLGYSVPGTLLWRRLFEPVTFSPGSEGFSVRLYSPDSPQGFFDPTTGDFNYPSGGDHVQTFQINVHVDPNYAFFQEEGTVYWLSVYVRYLHHSGPLSAKLGWKTSQDHAGSGSVWGVRDVFETQWWNGGELHNPSGGFSLDQAFVITTMLDWGDAPDDPNDPNDFATLLVPFALVNPAAVHVLDPDIRLGAFVDPEGDGQPTTNADGDDLNDTWPSAGSDDEDGVTIHANPLAPGLGTSVTATASVPGFLNAWVDFNGDNDWADEGEHVTSDLPLSAGANTVGVGFEVPLDAVSGTTYARYRFTSYDPAGALSYGGLALDGEVEDYMLVIDEAGEDRDFGDATDSVPGPAPYATLFANDGPRHYTGLSTPVYLGSLVDTEEDGQPVLTDDVADVDDEDGVVFTSPIIPGVLSSVQVTAGTSGFLGAWLDGDGVPGFHAADRICGNLSFSAPAILHLPFTPGPATDPASELRFRFDSGGGLAPTGLAMDGEVEDYRMPEDREMDYGDLFLTGPTVLSSDGARHFITPGYALGSIVDGETDGVPGAMADGDDTAGSDDEDGVTFTSQLAAGYAAAATVTATGSGLVNAWLVGGCMDGMDQVITDQAVSVGASGLVFTVPAGATASTPCAMRFRFNSASHGNPGFWGYAEDGEVEDHLVEISSEADMDYGDAPESATSYPTTLANDGPRHWIGSVYLGSAIDGEFDGQPTTDADGDDTAGTPDDEDGVTFPTGLRTAGYAQAEVDVVGGGYLNGWIDYNDDGDWDDVGEHVFNDLSLAAGQQQIDFDVPADAVVGDIYARFRISSQAGLSFYGDAPDGEVEDYKLEILQGYDFGDAPSPYPTLDASSGAKHQIVSGYYMGSAIDAEADGQPERRSAGDDEGPSYDDEDAIRMMTLMVPGASATVEVTSSSAGKLSAWVDFNADGDWGDAGEKILNDVTVNGIGAETFGFSVPAGADLLRPSYARFRFSTATGLSYTGTAVNGEVEDHILENELFSDGFESGDTTAW